MGIERLYQLSSRSHLIVILSLLFLLDGFGLWFTARLDYERTFERAQITLQKTAVSLEERVKRTITSSDLILQHVIERIQDKGMENVISSREEWERFRSDAQALPDAGSLCLLDGTGALRMNSREYPASRMNFSEREYFESHGTRKIESYIGPVTKGKTAKKYRFTISRRIDGENGSFQGVIVAAIVTDDFTNFVSTISIGENGSVTVLRTDGALILRQPMQDHYLGKTYTDMKMLDMISSGSLSGIHETRSSLDGANNLVAYRKIQGFPLVAVTGIPMEDIRQTWLAHVKSYLLVAAIALFALVVLSWLAYRSASRERRLEASLRESEDRHRSIFENSIDGIMLTAPATGGIIAANSAACKMLGTTEEEVARLGGIPFADHQDPRLAALMEERRRTGKCTGELTCIRKDGAKFPVEASSGIFTAKDETQRAIIVFRDVTERKHLEVRLQTYMEKLEQSNRDLQDFATIASHDMKEPLRKVATFGQMLKKRYVDALEGEGLDYLERMLGAVNRMQSLMDDLLDFSRVATRTEPFREVDLAGLVREILGDLEARIEQTGGSVEIGDLPVIEADPTQMTQLFQNLISNALKYGKKEEKPVVRLTAEPVNGKEACRIAVEDNGIGFDEQYVEKIFAPFQRLHGKSEYEGTGMGLAICRRIVERHGGSISAQSTPDKGSTFIVTLPFRQRG